MPESSTVAELLSNTQPGDDRSMAALLPLVYDELRALAASYLHRGGSTHTLQPTALVHEAFIKMVGSDREWSGRDHFMAVAAKAMRHVLVDHSRAKRSEKRGGGVRHEDISIAEVGSAQSEERELRVLELDDLLTELAKADDRSARVAEMRLFGGMELEPIARVLGVSRMTVTTDWQFARTWLAAKYHQDRSPRSPA
ncbi:MAG: ECF-type sigma factor [Phycisphaerales bacterium]